MEQQQLSQDFYHPSNLLEDIESQVQYQQEVNNLLATILQTKRQMEVTGQEMTVENTQADTRQLISYQQQYPRLVQKVKLKFNNFNLTISQLVKFIKIEQKFIRFKKQNHKKNCPKNSQTPLKDQKVKTCKKNLVEVHRMHNKRKPHHLNPRIFQ